MARTSSAAVQAILGDDYNGTTSLTPYIETASSIVDDVAECSLADGVTLSTAKLELIERWLSAWAYCQMDKSYSSRSTDGASGSFQGSTAMYFESNLYGQTAIQLDPSGCLKAQQDLATTVVEKEYTVEGFWLGKPQRDQLDWHDRNQ